MNREAWCTRCYGPSEADDKGCVRCRKSELTEAEIAKILARKKRVLNAERMRNRRARLRGQRTCINGISHGQATHGCRCAWCADVHKRGIEIVLATPKFLPPPGYGAVVGPRQSKEVA